MFTVSKLLDHLPSEGTLETKKLEKILKLTKKADRERLEIALSALSKLGIISQNETGLLSRIEDNSLLEARIRCSSKGYCFAIRDDDEDDIYIRDQNLNNAWNGDTVLVRITREGVRRRSPEGSVQCILERNTENLLGVVDKEEGNLIANPLDERILTSINLPEKDISYLDDENKDSVVEIHIDRYPLAQYPTEGHVVRPLPLNGGPSGDLDLLLTKSNLQIGSTSPRSSLKQPIEKNRVDLTSQSVLLLTSWTGANSPSLPAIHVSPHDGGIRLWIHSPSITERITIGSNLDLWLRDRAEAHCLADKWEPFVNESLDKASRFELDKVNDAISVCLDIDSCGEVKDWEFMLTKISPKAEISSKELESLASRKPRSRAIPAQLKKIKDHITQLETLIFCSELLSKCEKNKGSIELDLPTPKIDYLSDLLCEDPSTTYHQWKQPLNKEDPQSLLSPLIRIANEIWSEHSKQLKLPAILLETQSVDTNTLNELAKIALSLDLELELDSDGTPSASELSSAFSRTPCRRVLEKLLRHSLPDQVLKLAELNTSSDKEEHSDKFNLNHKYKNSAPWCCANLHYSDLLNQYILVNLLKEGKTRPSTRQKYQVNLGKRNCWMDIKWDIHTRTHQNSLHKLFNQTLINRLNSRRRQSRELQNSIVAMAQARAAEPFVGKEVEAIITGVQSYGFFAELPPSMAEGLVHVSSLNDDWYEYRSRQNRLVGRKSRKVYQLGNKVTLKVIKVDVLRNQIDLEVVHPINKSDDSLLLDNRGEELLENIEDSSPSSNRE